MADTKISALPSSTTPLTGTETVPIVQSGTTKKVSVANLTAGRQVDTSYINVTGSGAGGTQVLGKLNAAADAFSNSVEFILEPLVSGQTTTAIGAQREGSGTGAAVYLKAGGAEVLRGTVAGNIVVSKGDLSISTANKGILFDGNGSVLWRCGAGTPEGSVTAPVGSIYTRTDGGANTTLYVKESGTGNTGWVAK